MYMGAAVVTSSSEMIVGLVSITRSRHNGRVAAVSEVRTGVVTLPLQPSAVHAVGLWRRSLRHPAVGALRVALHT